MAYFHFVLVCLIWGSSFILMKKAGLAFGMITIAGGRVAGGALALGMIWLVTRQKSNLRLKHFPLIFLLAAMGQMLPFILQPYLIVKHNASGFMGMMLCFVPLITIAVSIPVLHIVPSPRQIIGVLGGFAGLALVASEGFRRAVPVSDLLWALSIPFCYSLANTLIRKFFSEVPALPLTMLMLTCSSAVLLPLGLWRESIQWQAEGLGWAVLSLLTLAFIATGIALFLFLQLVQQKGPLFAGMVTYVIPALAVVVGYLDGESVSTQQLYALGVVISMVALVQTGQSRPIARWKKTASENSSDATARDSR